jgi:hypothetical protein
MKRSLLAAPLCVGLALPAALHSQGVQFTFSGVASQELVQSHIDATSARFAGLMLGGEGTLISNRLLVRVRYAEGRINPKGGTGVGLLGLGTTDSRDVVEGDALVGYRATSWLTLWGGPSARAYTIGDNNERWLIWTGRAAGRGTLLPGRMQTFVEVYGAFSGNVGDPPLKVGGSGVNGGLEVRLGQTGLFWGRLGYRMESTHAAGLRETVESVTLSLVYGLPQ